VKFEVLVAITAAKNTAAWDMTLCSLEEINFYGTCNSEILRVGTTDSSQSPDKCLQYHLTPFFVDYTDSAW
jgi:hypothetical protein